MDQLMCVFLFPHPLLIYNKQYWYVVISLIVGMSDPECRWSNERHEEMYVCIYNKQYVVIRLIVGMSDPECPWSNERQEENALCKAESLNIIVEKCEGI